MSLNPDYCTALSALIRPNLNMGCHFILVRTLRGKVTENTSSFVGKYSRFGFDLFSYKDERFKFSSSGKPNTHRVHVYVMQLLLAPRGVCLLKAPVLLILIRPHRRR